MTLYPVLTTSSDKFATLRYRPIFPSRGLSTLISRNRFCFIFKKHKDSEMAMILGPNITIANCKPAPDQKPNVRWKGAIKK